MDTPRIPTRILFVAVLIGATTSSQAQSTRELDAALLQMSERGDLKDTGAPQVIQKPAQVRYELGAVVDVRTAQRSGLPVMALTPDGPAARIGFKVGDRLVSMNGVRLDGASPPAPLLEQALQRGEGRVVADVLRGSVPTKLSGAAGVVAVPAYRLEIGADAKGTCGFVTARAGTVPKTRNIFRADITTIDGRSTPLQSVNRHRLAVGRHVLVVQELIDTNRLSPSQLVQINKMKRFALAKAYKPLVVDVKPNMSYRIGARLLKDKLDTQSLRDNAYWEPVVWEEVAERCP
ncbi:PDZ domain-containing protein [Pseudoxanthomonas mexicana]